MEIGRHQRKCSVCSHPELRAIEKDYLGWVTMAECARRYSLPKNSMENHVAAFHLDEKLRRNKLVGLEQIMAAGLTALKPGDVSAANVVAAMQLHAKLQGELIDRTMDISNKLEKCSDAELDFYAVHGRIPEPGELQDGPDDEQ